MELVQSLYRSAIRWVVGVASPDLNVLTDVGFVELLQIVSAHADAADWNLCQLEHVYSIYRDLCSPPQRSSHVCCSSSVGGPRYLEGWVKSLSKLPSQNSTASHNGAAPLVSKRCCGNPHAVNVYSHHGETVCAHSHSEGARLPRVPAQRMYTDARNRSVLQARSVMNTFLGSLTVERRMDSPGSSR